MPHDYDEMLAVFEEEYEREEISYAEYLDFFHLWTESVAPTPELGLFFDLSL